MQKTNALTKTLYVVLVALTAMAVMFMFTACGQKETTIKINKTLDKTYDGTAVTLTEEDISTDSDGSISITWYSGETMLTVAPTEAGTYKVVVSTAATDNYKAGSAEQEFTITQSLTKDTLTSIISATQTAISNEKTAISNREEEASDDASGALAYLENALSQMNKGEALFVLNLSTTEFNKNPTAIAESDSIISKQRVYINAEGNLEFIYWGEGRNAIDTEHFILGAKLIISGDFMYNSITSVEIQELDFGRPDETGDTYRFIRKIASYNFATNTPVYTNDEHDGIASIENLDEYKEFVAFYGDIDEDDVQFVYDSGNKVYNRK